MNPTPLPLLHKTDSPNRDLQTERVKMRDMLLVFNDKCNFILRHFKYNQMTQRCKTALVSNNHNDY